MSSFNQSVYTFSEKNPHLSIIISYHSQKWDGTDSWNTSSWKTITPFSCTINTNTTDDLEPGQQQALYRTLSTGTLQLRHNGCDGISNHQPYYCWLNCFFQMQIKENIKAPHHWPLCGGGGDSAVTSEFPAQRAGNAENVSISWRHYEILNPVGYQKGLIFMVNPKQWLEVQTVDFIVFNGIKYIIYPLHYQKRNWITDSRQLHIMRTRQLKLGLHLTNKDQPSLCQLVISRFPSERVRSAMCRSMVTMLLAWTSSWTNSQVADYLRCCDIHVTSL